MAAKPNLEIVHRTHQGMVRRHNEDSVAISEEAGLAILADGMGGYNAGEVASGMATILLCNQLAADINQYHAQGLLNDGYAVLYECLQNRLNKTNEAIFRSSKNWPEYAGMGTTLVMALFVDKTIIITHIGDSRLYRLRGDRFIQMTRDHSLLQAQIDAGLLSAQQAQLSKNKNLITRALGVSEVVEAEIHQSPIQVGDIYLLCSDGLSDLVSEAEIQHTMSRFGMRLEDMADILIQQANDRGGYDNTSLILAKVLPEHAESPNISLRGILFRLTNWWQFWSQSWRN